MTNGASIQKKSSFPLLVGILFVPYIFGWLTLRDGYAKKIRVLAFAWMVAVLVIVGGNVARLDRRATNPSATSNAQTFASGTQKRLPMSRSQVADMCAKLGMYGMAYGNSKYYGHGPGSVFSNVAEEINAYPSDMRENIRNTWSKMVGKIDRSSPQALVVFTDSRSAAALTEGCQKLWVQYGLVN